MQAYKLKGSTQGSVTFVQTFEILQSGGKILEKIREKNLSTNWFLFQTRDGAVKHKNPAGGTFFFVITRVTIVYILIHLVLTFVFSHISILLQVLKKRAMQAWIFLHHPNTDVQAQYGSVKVCTMHVSQLYIFLTVQLVQRLANL